MTSFNFRLQVGLLVLAGAWVNCQNLRAVNYEVYPGSAFYLDQMVDGSSYPYVAQFGNGFYHHPVGFGANSSPVLTTL